VIEFLMRASAMRSSSRLVSPSLTRVWWGNAFVPPSE